MFFFIWLYSFFILSEFLGLLSCFVLFCVKKAKTSQASGGLLSGFQLVRPPQKQRLRPRYITRHIAFSAFLPQDAKIRRCAGMRTAGFHLSIFLIVLRKDARNLLLRLHDLVMKALGRHAHRTMAEDDQLL